MRHAVLLLGLASLSACSGAEVCPGGGVLDGDFCDWDHHAWCVRTELDELGTPFRETEVTYDDARRPVLTLESLVSEDGTRSPYIRTAFLYEGSTEIIEVDRGVDGNLESRDVMDFDEAGRLVRLQQDEPVGGVVDVEWTWVYDADGREIGGAVDSVIDADDHTWTRTWEGDSEDGVEVMVYDSSQGTAQRVAWTRENGLLVAREWGFLDADSTTLIEYDIEQRGIPIAAVERSTAEVDPFVEVAWSYDEAGRLVERAEAYANADTAVFRTERDEEGRRVGHQRIVNGVAMESQSWTYDCLD